MTTDKKSQLENFLRKRIAPLQGTLPAHISVDRQIQLAIIAVLKDPSLANCSNESIFNAVRTACQIGLEIGVAGHGFLSGKSGFAEFIPGWQGLVDLINRTGRAGVSTGAVYQGDHFDWQLGTDPSLTHKPNPNDFKWQSITHFYAIGKVKDSPFPNIEVWPASRMIEHLNRYNTIGADHYAVADGGANFEMYGRKIVLLQVMKYLPKSTELQRAFDVANASESGKPFTFDGDTTTVDNKPAAAAEEINYCSDADFKANTPAWKKHITTGAMDHATLFTVIAMKHRLTDKQQATVLNWSLSTKKAN